MSQNEANDNQQKIYQFIVETQQRLGRSPSRREIKKAVGVSSTSHLEHNLIMLEKAGKIELVDNEDYGIRLIKSKHGIPIEGYIAAGKPIENFIVRDQVLDLGFKYQDEYSYVLIVKGDSMIDDGIFDGDYVVVRRQNTCETGEVVVAVHMIEPFGATLKRFVREKGRIRLQSANRKMQSEYTINIENETWISEWQIQGVVVAIHRDYSKK